MNDTNARYLLEFRLSGQYNWTQGSSFNHLKYAKACVNATLENHPDILEGRIFDWRHMAYRFYRTTFPFRI